MPYTVYDHQYVNTSDHERIIHYEHAHYVGNSPPNINDANLRHGRRPHRTYNESGDWYAVHTH